MRPHHHLDPSTILALASGTLDEAFAIVAASHLALCDACRADVRIAEQLGGKLMDGIEERSVTSSCRAKTLSLIDHVVVHHLPAEPPARSDLPLPLARVLNGASLSSIRWKRKAPGVEMFDVRLSPAAKGQLKLLRVGAGRTVPEHGHGGEEITMILQGAYRDHLGRFARGDVADLDAEIVHKPVIEGDGDCICLLAIERPTRFKSLAVRLVQPFIGI